MNLSLYGYGGRWLMIDCGITFADDTMPGVEILMADPAFIAERRDALVGLVATHAHEDHIGAIPYLWRRLSCPVYATPFTAAVLRAQADRGRARARGAAHRGADVGHSSRVGPFELELITLTHSIPEPNAVVLRTPLGTVLHTGDWKFDPEPLIGPTYDLAALERLGDEGVLAMVCDSTNAMRAGRFGLGGRGAPRAHRSRRALPEPRRHRLLRLERGAARIRGGGGGGAMTAMSRWSDARCGASSRRRARPAISRTWPPSSPRRRPPICRATRCCWSAPAARASRARRWCASPPTSTRISCSKRGDTVIFSSRVIPGNERAIGRLQNALVRLGVEIITEHDHFVHVSGHPAQDELKRMYGAVRPRIAVPVHGEARHLMAQAQLAGRMPRAAADRHPQRRGREARARPGRGDRRSADRAARRRRQGAARRRRRDAEEPPAHDLQRRGACDHRARRRRAASRRRPQVTVQGLAERRRSDAAERMAAERRRRGRRRSAPRERRDDAAVREAARVAYAA